MAGWYKALLPLTQYDRNNLAKLSPFLEGKDFRKVKRHIKRGELGVSYHSFGISKTVGEDLVYPQIDVGVDDHALAMFARGHNDEILGRMRKRVFREFSKDAMARLKAHVAPDILGLEEAKEASILQLFAAEPVHILLLGDPGTGKTEILRSVSHLHPITSFGLGSGTSGAGLSATVRGGEVQKGLLPLADGGICCIDELNLLKSGDRGALYNAMEKGFITYSKADKNVEIEAKVRVLATANPKGDRFVGKSIDILKKQLPFDPALLTRFHLVFLIRKPSVAEFRSIAKKIVSESTHASKIRAADVTFIKDYVGFAESINVKFPKRFEKEIVSFIERIKKGEDRFLVEIGPRLVIGIIRLAKAAARLELRIDVNERDIALVRRLVEASLEVKRAS
ncbi:AAA family ATPase [Candidatus Woesearchaeota archaeon]|nr:AAA family ATPase [Candidatus Woesearchaeota archaeon]